MNTVYFAKHILLDTGEILANGAVSVSGGRIVDVGLRGQVRRSSDERLVNLGDLLLMPGLINMHTHLEETPIRANTKAPGEPFAEWNIKKYSRMRQLDPERVCNGIRLRTRELISQGITTVVDSTRTGLSAYVLTREAIRSVVIREIADEDFLDEGIDGVRQWQDIGSAFGYGAAPHALYSLRTAGHRKLKEFVNKSGALWSCHVAESAEEMQAFCEQSGDFFFSQTRRHPWPAGTSRVSPIQYALAENLIPPRAILYHCNYATSYELALLAARRAFVTYCHRYSKVMEHKSFPIEVARNRKVRICLGSEGMVAVGGTNLFDDLCELKKAHPHISAAEMLNWVTKNPAAALRASDKLGSLTPGKYADIIGVRFSCNSGEDVLEKLLISDQKIAFVMVGGEEIIVDY